MSVLTEESKEVLAVSIKSATKAIFESKINDKIDEKYNKDDKAKKESEDEELDEDESVVGVRTGSGKKKDEFEINRLGDLKSHAKKYQYLMVTKKNGDEIEYTVENGKLIEM